MPLLKLLHFAVFVTQLGLGVLQLLLADLPEGINLILHAHTETVPLGTVGQQCSDVLLVPRSGSGFEMLIPTHISTQFASPFQTQKWEPDIEPLDAAHEDPLCLERPHLPSP